jgi:hypothetical protein
MMSINEASVKPRKFPLGSLLLIVGAFVGGPIAALSLYGISEITELITAAGLEEWVAMIVVYPLLAIGFLVALATVVLLVGSPFIIIHFCGALMLWYMGRPPRNSSKKLTEAPQ